MIVSSLALVCACAGVVGARRQATSPQEPAPNQTPRVGERVQLTSLHISIYGRDGKFIDGLPQEAFDIYEDGGRQRIAVFGQEDEPAKIGLLVDSSGSMFRAIKPESEALKRIVQASNTQDKFFAVAFADSVRPAANVEELIKSLDARGATKMLDALYFGLVELADTRNSRKALLIISDGGDNNSKHSRDELRKLVRNSGVPIYAFRLPDERPAADREQQVAGSHFLDELCKMSGGRFISAKAMTDLPNLAAEVAN